MNSLDTIMFSSQSLQTYPTGLYFTASLYGTSSWTNTASFENGIFSNFTLQTQSYSIGPIDYFIIMSGSSTLSASLPTSTPGRTLVIKNVSPYILTITGSQNIDNSNNLLVNQWSSAELIGSISQWYLV